MMMIPCATTLSVNNFQTDRIPIHTSSIYALHHKLTDFILLTASSILTFKLKKAPKPYNKVSMKTLWLVYF